MPDLHERHAGLHELQGRETTAAKLTVAVTVFGFFPLAGDIEGLAGSHQADRP